jgi:RHS repeat-associated protein
MAGRRFIRLSLSALVAALVVPAVQYGTGHEVASAAPLSLGYSNYATNLPNGGIGPTGLAFDTDGSLFIQDYWNGTLYHVPAGGGDVTGHQLTSLPGTPDGLAMTPDGAHLYVARQGASDVVEVNKSTGTILRTVATGLTCASDIVVDPISSDLFVSEPCSDGSGVGVRRISNPTGPSPTVSAYSNPGSVDGMVFASDGTLYAVQNAQHVVYAINGTATATPGGYTALGVVYNAGSVGVLAPSVGSAPTLLVGTYWPYIGTIDLSQSPPAISNYSLYTSQNRGSVLVTGPDQCVYAAELSSVIRVTNSVGQCNPPGEAWVSPATAGPQGSETYGSSNPADTSVDLSLAAEGVNSATGNRVEDATDLSFPDRLGGLSVARTYNSQAAAVATSPGPLGYGWASTLTMSASTDQITGVVTVTNANGSTATFTPSGSAFTAPVWVTARLSTNPDGSLTYLLANQTAYHFDTTGRLITVTDRNGDQQRLAYDPSGQLQTVTDSDGHQLTVTVVNGLISQLVDNIGRSVTYSYDAASNLISATVALGAASTTTGHGYDPSHRLTSVTTPEQKLWTTVYDPSSGRVARELDPDQNSFVFSYTTATTTLTDRSGSATVETFTAGRLSTMTRGAGSTRPSTWRYGYDSAGRLTGIIDQDGWLSTRSYDARGNLTSSRDGSGHTSTWTYDSQNDVLTYTSGRGETTSFRYDARGNLQTVHRVLAETGDSVDTILLHGDSQHPGDVTGVTDPTRRTISIGRDPQGEVASVADANGDTAKAWYNGAGQLTQLQSANGGIWHITPDVQGRPLSVVDPLSHQVRWTYNGEGGFTTVTDADLQQTTYHYDNEARLSSVDLPGITGSPQRTYYADGHLHTERNAAGGTTTYQEDAQGRTSSVSDPLNRTTTYAYDNSGNVISRTDPDGTVTTYTFDGAGRPATETYNTDQTPDAVFNYDADGQPSTMTDTTGTTTWHWDSLHRLSSLTDGAGKAVAYAYDLAGRRTSLTYPAMQGDTGPVTAQWGYDAVGHLSSISDWLGHVTAVGHDPAGDLSSLVYPNGIVAQYSYDSTDQLSDIEYGSAATGAATAPVLSFPVTRDAAGRITGYNPSGEPAGALATAGHDRLGDLVSVEPAAADSITSTTGAVVGRSYRFDSALRLTEAVDGVAGASQLPSIAFGDHTLSYDAAGEATAITDATTQQSTAMSYDGRGDRVSTGTLLSAIFNPDGRMTQLTTQVAGTTTSVIHYAYDGDGVRVGKSTGGTLSSQYEHFTYDRSGAVPLLLQDGATRYVTSPDGLPLEQVASDGTVSYFHHDPLGSTAALTDSSGTVAARYAYDPWGNTVAQSGTAQTPLRFTGQYTDSESGYIVMGQRYYDPATAQFVSADLSRSVTPPPYSYASEDPLDNIDPSGLAARSVWTTPAPRSALGTAAATTAAADSIYREVSQ